MWLRVSCSSQYFSHRLRLCQDKILNFTLPTGDDPPVVLSTDLDVAGVLPILGPELRIALVHVLVKQSHLHHTLDDRDLVSPRYDEQAVALRAVQRGSEGLVDVVADLELVTALTLDLHLLLSLSGLERRQNADVGLRDGDAGIDHSPIFNLRRPRNDPVVDSVLFERVEHQMSPEKSSLVDDSDLISDVEVLAHDSLLLPIVEL